MTFPLWFIAWVLGSFALFCLGVGLWLILVFVRYIWEVPYWRKARDSAMCRDVQNRLVAQYKSGVPIDEVRWYKPFPSVKLPPSLEEAKHD